MARTKNSPDVAPSAAHAAPDPAPAPGAAPAGDSPAAAVCAALAASPGSTVAVIADAAGTGKPDARAALLAMEAAGTATRVKGGKPGIPDTWTLADAPQDDAGTAGAGPEREQGGQPGDGTASSPDGPRDDEAAGEAGQDAAAGTTSPGQQDAGADAGTGAGAGDGTSAAPDSGTAGSGPRDDAPAGDGPGDSADGGQDGKATPDSSSRQDPDQGDDAPGDGAALADSGGEAGDAPDPALVSEIAERIAQVKAAAGAAAIALAGDGNLRAALAGLDEIAEQAAQARRSLKAAIGGRKAPAARPGGLRDKVLAHLDAHPGKEFTPHEIHKVLDHSSGAIANALDTLVKHGEAELASEKPRRFRRAAGKATPAAPGGAGSEHDDGTELAGAA